MSMLADFETSSIFTAPSRKTTIPILATIPPEVKAIHRKDIFEQTDDRFVIATMQRFNPYFELILEQAMQSGNSYSPLWQKYAGLVPLHIEAMTDPALIEYNERRQNTNPIIRLYDVFWQGASTIPSFATNLAQLIYSDDIKSVGQFQQQAIKRGAVGILAKAPEVIKPPRNRVLERGKGVIPIEYFALDPETSIIQYHDDPSVKPNFAKIIEEGLTMCSAPYGLLDPSTETQEVCRSHNARMGSVNRSSSLFLPDNPENVTSMAEVFAYDALLTGPSTLWFPFLEERGISNWSDALPGTRLPDGTIMYRRMIEPPKQATVYTTQ